MLELTRLDHVRYTFVVVGGPGLHWRVRRIHWSEGLSETYEMVVDVMGDGTEIDIDELLASSVELTIERSGHLRMAYGVVHRVEDRGWSNDQHMLQIHAVPALRLLEYRVDTRVFQGQTVPEILAAVLEPALAEYGREVDATSGLSADYQARDYCVQFRESDFDFCARLMEEEGITYVFESDDENGCEKLVLIDNNEAYPDVLLLQDDTVPIITERFDEADRESIQTFVYSLSERTTTVATRAYNWKTPSAFDEGLEGNPDDQGRTRELYTFDDRRQIVDDPIADPQAQSFDGSNLAQRGPAAVRYLEFSQRDKRLVLGSSNVTGFSAGLRFTLGEHHHDELAHHSFLIARLIHEGDAPDVEIGHGTSDQPLYTNRFECIPIEHPYRPSRHTPKPRVYGAQTATVMGPADDPSEDIHTDPHGRIKVRFHWDRLSPEDGTASCWVRVAQSWAGSGWGSMFIPRVGMEVVVDFLDGNPDRPLVVGCVYNGTKIPPYKLPDEKTKSTLKSNSSPGGGGFNELRFDDAKSNEEIFLHAQKDLNEIVLNDHTTKVSANHSTTVGGDQTNTVSGHQTNTVSGDQTESVSGDVTISVTKNRTVTVTGSQSVTVTGSASADGVNGSKVGITGDYVLDTSNTISVQAPTKITLTCGGSTLVMEPGKIAVSAGGGASLVLDANVSASSSGGSNVTLDANVSATSSGGSNVTLDSNATTTSSGGSQVLLDANATMTSPGSALVGAPTSTLAGDGGGVEAGPAGLLASGNKVEVSGGTVDIMGGVVKIN